ncbi:hypothetical protein [Candidatus Cardinium hertigii]|uniref:Uncharacterized protein n=1 Tax=Candidatus Cardinium hertigii TaxID=247481 RepID=A0A2Z3LAF9_9BACT|nr:hypothetical protein [Candidatus Cardinium hertigii]AWN82297.1 hypothetical protein DK880_01000 [Candidatus Cardinium hertigii]
MSTRTQKEKLILLTTLCLLSAKSCNGSKLGRSEHERYLPTPNPNQATAISAKGEEKTPEATPAQKDNKLPNATAISTSINDTTEAEAEATSAEKDNPKTGSDPTKRGGILSRLPFMNKKANK